MCIDCHNIVAAIHGSSSRYLALCNHDTFDQTLSMYKDCNAKFFWMYRKENDFAHHLARYAAKSVVKLSSKKIKEEEEENYY